MNRQEQLLEENIARLIQSASNPGARPGDRIRMQTFQLLVAQMQSQSADIPFPDAIIGLLGGILALAAVWLVGGVIMTGAQWTANPSLLFVALWLLLNLALVPVASIVIVRRRQYGNQTKHQTQAGASLRRGR